MESSMCFRRWQVSSKTATDSEKIEAARAVMKEYYDALKRQDFVGAGVLASKKNIHRGRIKEMCGEDPVTGKPLFKMVDGKVVTANLMRASWGPLCAKEMGWRLRKATVAFLGIKGSHMIQFKVTAEAKDGQGKIRRGTAKPNALFESLGWRVNIPSATICWR